MTADVLSPDNTDIARAAEITARAVQQARWSVSLQKRPATQALSMDAEGRVTNEAGVTLPFVSLQWPGVEGRR